MGVGAGLCMYDVVVKSSRSLSHLLMTDFLYLPSTRLFTNGMSHACLFTVTRDSEDCYYTGEDYSDTVTSNAAGALYLYLYCYILVVLFYLFPTTDFSTSLGRFSRKFATRRGVF